MIKKYIGYVEDKENGGTIPKYKRTTPKLFAEKLIMDKLSDVSGYWQEYSGSDDMTDKEIELVEDQLKKITKRIAKVIHYDNNDNGGN